jgi:hypothetical protein
MRIRYIYPVTAVLALLSVSCSKGTPETPPARMGENLRVGSLVYTVTETQWADQLGTDLAVARMPSHRFLMVRLSVTNSGGEETIIPAMSLLDVNGKIYAELTDGSGVPNWLGMIRRIKPAQTEHGSVLFDVPVNEYKLQVSYDGDDPEQEIIGMVNLPLKFEGDFAPPPADKAVPAR